MNLIHYRKGGTEEMEMNKKLFYTFVVIAIWSLIIISLTNIFDLKVTSYGYWGALIIGLVTELYALGLGYKIIDKSHPSDN